MRDIKTNKQREREPKSALSIRDGGSGCVSTKQTKRKKQDRRARVELLLSLNVKLILKKNPVLIPQWGNVHLLFPIIKIALNS